MPLQDLGIDPQCIGKKVNLNIRPIKHNIMAISIIPAILAGYLSARPFSGEKEGENGQFWGPMKRDLGNYTIHLHHWVVSSITLITLWSLHFYHNVIYGFLIGIAMHGLSYKDRFKVIYRRTI